MILARKAVDYFLDNPLKIVKGVLALSLVGYIVWGHYTIKHLRKTNADQGAVITTQDKTINDLRDMTKRFEAATTEIIKHNKDNAKIYHENAMQIEKAEPDESPCASSPVLRGSLDRLRGSLKTN